MAFFQMDFLSHALGQAVCVNIILPEKREQEGFKTLWLLHGLSDDHTAWMRYTSIERYARDYGIGVVMPCVDRSWYTDTAYGKQYFTFLTKELPEMMAYYFKGYSPAREDNFIMGNSMGGYGALKAALTYPEQYGFCASFSGSVDITRKNLSYNLEEWRSIFGFDLESASQLEGTKHDVFALAKEAKDFPYLYMWCGSEDRLLEGNRQFAALLSQRNVPHTFIISEGHHTWDCWDVQLQNALAFWREQTENN